MAAKEHKERKGFLAERGCGRRPSRSALPFSRTLELLSVLRLVLRTQPRSFAFSAFFCG